MSRKPKRRLGEGLLHLSYSSRLFILIAALTVICEGAFLWFQYNREQEFRRERLNAQLQLINSQLLDHYEGGVVDVEEWARTIDLPIKQLQLSIFDKDGNVIYDNNRTPNLIDASVTAELPEIKMALNSEDRRGFSVHETTSDLNDFYYYAALREGDVIARTGALGMQVGLSDFMEVDRSFIWYAAGIFVFILILAYLATSRIGRTISRLNEFSAKAERGEPIYDTEVFPNNELGHISHHIVLLYSQLQRTIADRDRQAALALHEEAEKIKMKKELTNNINHELKTPVSAISLQMETLIENKDRLTEKQKDDLIERCKANADRLLQMIKDILTLNRMEEGSEAIQKEILSLRDVIDEVLESVEVKALNAGIEYEVDLPEAMPMLGNAPLLESIFRNLLTNAIAYSGGTLFTVRLEDEDIASYRVIVSDNGTGIDPSHFPHLFDRFYRLDKGRSRKHGGTGMGLAIVKNAAQFHGGDITVRNLPTGGLEFTITLAKR